MTARQTGSKPPLMPQVALHNFTIKTGHNLIVDEELRDIQVSSICTTIMTPDY